MNNVVGVLRLELGLAACSEVHEELWPGLHASPLDGSQKACVDVALRVKPSRQDADAAVRPGMANNPAGSKLGAASQVLAASARSVPKNAQRFRQELLRLRASLLFCFDSMELASGVPEMRGGGGHLVIMDSKEEYAFVARLRGNTEAYVGATRDTSTGGWEWIDGRPCHDIPCGGGQPGNGPFEMYLGFHKEPLGLHDYHLNDRLPFVCEWEE